MAIFIGTSGWSYHEWRGGFYPQGMKAEQYLVHYATRFATVEINGTAYRTPTVETVRRWSDSMPPGFIAAVKLSHAITHFHRLRDCQALLLEFLASVHHLGEHLGPVLAQLPPGFAPDLGLLRDFLAMVRTVMADSVRPLVVEFRHPGWLNEKTAQILAQAEATWCVADMPVCPVDGPLPGSRVLYLRRHGPDGRYRGSYADAVLQHDADRLCTWAERGLDAFAYFNNTADGAAVRDARRLQELVTASRGHAPATDRHWRVGEES